jgi:A118 family predicted phage portal protein
MTDVYADMAEADVWYVGDKRALAEYYGRAVQRERDRPSVEARLWAQPRPLDEPERRVHVPVAGDIASASAALLCSEAPTIRFEDTLTQKRFDKLAEDGGLHMRLLEALELGAALGDSYLTTVWDKEAVPDRPILTSWAGDMAIPTIRYGRLIECTFWRELSREGDTVVRLLERHAVEQRVGLIEYGLYEGTAAHLGKRIPYREHPDAEHIDALVDRDGRQLTGIDMLTATHIPNLRPNRRHRGYLGRSDFAAPVWDQFDAIDQTMTSWMRDIRLGQGRIIVPQGALSDLGEGRGSHFDMHREVYDELSMPPGTGEGLTVAQFAIRIEEHRGTFDHLLSTIARSCGYSPSTFGLAEAGERTATEVIDRKASSMSTTEHKGMYVKTSLRRIVQSWLALDAAHFASGVDASTPPTVEMAPPERQSPESLARTLQMLRNAEVISDYLSVKMQHPEYTEPQILEEVDRMKADRTTEADPWADGAAVAGNLLGRGAADGPPVEEPPEGNAAE